MSRLLWGNSLAAFREFWRFFSVNSVYHKQSDIVSLATLLLLRSWSDVTDCPYALEGDAVTRCTSNPPEVTSCHLSLFCSREADLMLRTAFMPLKVTQVTRYTGGTGEKSSCERYLRIVLGSAPVSFEISLIRYPQLLISLIWLIWDIVYIFLSSFE